MSVLSGSLEAFALPDVMRLVGQNRVSGALKVHRESGEGTIYFNEGYVYFASSTITQGLLGQRLTAAKVISQNQLLKVLDEQKRTGARMGAMLVEKGVIEPETLNVFLREQAQDAIFGLLQWDVGEFSVEAGETSTQAIGMLVSVENLLMESSRRLEEWDVIQRKIPSLDVAVKMAAEAPEETVEINIKPEEWRLLVLSDGVRTIRQIAEATGNSEFETCKALYGLITSGLLELVGEIDAAGATPVREEREPAPVTSLDDRRVAEGKAAAARAASARGAEAKLPEAKPSESKASEAKPSTAKASDEAEPAAAKSNGKSAGKTGEPVHLESGISKEELLRLIAGVRNL